MVFFSYPWSFDFLKETHLFISKYPLEVLAHQCSVELCFMCAPLPFWTSESVKFFCVHKSFAAHRIVLGQHGALTNLFTQSLVHWHPSSLQKDGNIMWEKGGDVHWNFLVLIGQGKILLPHPQFLCSICCSIYVAFHLPLLFKFNQIQKEQEQQQNFLVSSPKQVWVG